MIAKLRRLRGAASELARRAAPGIVEAVQSAAKAGTSPTGEAWAPRKKDGARALVNAADAVQGRADGAMVSLKLVDTTTGSAKVQAIQSHRRQILPETGSIPPKVEKALMKAAHETFAAMIGGGR